MVPLHDTEDFIQSPSAKPATTPKGSRSPQAAPERGSARAQADHPLADITPVATSEARCVLTPGNLMIARLLTLLPLPAGILGGGILIVAGCFFYESGAGAVAPFVLLGVVWGTACEITRTWFHHLLASHFLLAVARKNFAQRANPIARFGDSESEFLEIIPRGNWNGAASDIGLWRIDRDKRQFLFEGDLRRYRIPFESVISCDVDDFHLPNQHDVQFAVVLQVESTEGPRQIPFIARHLSFAPRRTRERQRVAESLCQRIREAIA